nr:unnamed protein product [Callosobruchus analis]
MQKYYILKQTVYKGCRKTSWTLKREGGRLDILQDQYKEFISTRKKRLYQMYEAYPLLAQRDWRKIKYAAKKSD